MGTLVHVGKIVDLGSISGTESKRAMLFFAFPFVFLAGSVFLHSLKGACVLFVFRTRVCVCVCVCVCFASLFFVFALLSSA